MAARRVDCMPGWAALGLLSGVHATPGLRAYNLYNLRRDFLDFTWRQLARTIQDDVDVGSEQAIGANVTVLMQGSCLEIRSGEGNGIAVADGLAGNLAQNYVVAREGRNYQSRASLAGAQVREGKGNDNDITFHKLAHAASSSGLFQSRPSAASEANMNSMAFVAASRKIPPSSRSER